MNAATRQYVDRRPASHEPPVAVTNGLTLEGKRSPCEQTDRKADIGKGIPDEAQGTDPDGARSGRKAAASLVEVLGEVL